MPLSQDEQVKFKALYLQTARDYVKELKENLDQLLTGNETSEVVDTVHRAAHSLKGQSAMMEFSSFAALSAVIEDAFQAKKQNNTAFSHEQLQAFREAANEMEESLDEIDKNNKEKDVSAFTESLKSKV